METVFSRNISASASSGKQIAEDDYDDLIIVKSGMSGFSRAKLKACMDALGLCVARDGSESCCWCV